MSQISYLNLELFSCAMGKFCLYACLCATNFNVGKLQLFLRLMLIVFNNLIHILSSHIIINFLNLLSYLLLKILLRLATYNCVVFYFCFESTIHAYSIVKI